MCKKHLEYMSHVLLSVLSGEVCFVSFPLLLTSLKNISNVKDLKNDCIITMLLGITGIFQASRCGKREGQGGGGGGGLAVDLVPVAFASLSFLQEGPYEGVHNIRLVLLQPVTGPRYDVETEMIPDVEAACLGHFLLEEGISLPPQQQHRRPDMVLAQGEGAEDTKEKIQNMIGCEILRENVSLFYS